MRRMLMSAQEVRLQDQKSDRGLCMTEYKTVIGLETHAELNTKTKIFCGCANQFGSEPNSNVCPVCLGLPGALPVLNKSVVEYAVRMGLALNCRINNVSKLDRKNYFYPDLPKAYQISQSYVPLCEDGYVDFWYDGSVRRVHIERIHIEEDAGKLVHSDSDDSVSYVDLNRCGVPLIEIVSKPDISSSGEAYAYLKTIKSILRYLDICDCKMQEGSIRCDVNISLSREGEPLGTRCEMKNVNSFSAVTRAIEFEIKRQKHMLDCGEKVVQQTLRWDDVKGRSTLLRTKENADDYRYFPEPDIPPFEISTERVSELSDQQPELPNIKLIRYVSEFGIDEKSAEYIADDIELAQFFDECCSSQRHAPKSYCSWIMSELVKHLNAQSCSFSQTKLTVLGLNDLLDAVDREKISATAAKRVFEVLLVEEQAVTDIINELGLAQVSDETTLKDIAVLVINENAKPVSDYRAGKTNALGFLIGQCMKKSKGKADPVKMKSILLDLLG